LYSYDAHSQTGYEHRRQCLEELLHSGYKVQDPNYQDQIIRTAIRKPEEGGRVARTGLVGGSFIRVTRHRATYGFDNRLIHIPLVGLSLDP
jgi:hypothetical protein